MTGGPYTLEPAYVDEDVQIVVAVEDDGAPITDYTLSFRLYRPDGTLVDGGTSVAVTDDEAREITGSVVGLTLAPGRYRWAIRRTDAAKRTVTAWGMLTIFNAEPS